MPLVPVTVTVKVAALGQLTVKAEVPDTPRVTFDTLRIALQPVGAPVGVSETTPVNPLTAVTVIVDTAEDPATKVSDVGLAVTVKSVTVTATVAEWDSEPLVPVTVTVKLAEPEQLTVSVEVPDAPKVILVGFRVAVQPAGAPVAVSETTPLKPLTDVTLINELPEDTATKLIEVGLATTVKSEVAAPAGKIVNATTINRIMNGTMRVLIMDSSHWQVISRRGECGYILFKSC